jgi:hypothetical protein
MAGSVDRANRPGSLLAFPLLLVGAALLVVFWSFSRLSAARAEARSEIRNRDRIEQLVAAIDAESSSAINFEALYPRKPYFASDIIASWREEGIPFSTPPLVGEVVEAVVLSGANGTIRRQEVQCSVTSEPLELILQWIDNVLRRPNLKGQVWVSSLQIRPAGPGWGASIRFGAYEYRK